eukprot:TRINITY_DN937_c0_g1_i3.p1 TRINITY_DN937_c0_g1~~TRINITY_DN937_c0_g1_i3.p1  ORF type:complete len:1762 (-),score=318.92 TRINITY_DN937_c0_g1_i3:233-5518(-)
MGAALLRVVTRNGTHNTSGFGDVALTALQQAVPLAMSRPDLFQACLPPLLSLLFVTDVDRQSPTCLDALTRILKDAHTHPLFANAHKSGPNLPRFIGQVVTTLATNLTAHQEYVPQFISLLTHKHSNNTLTRNDGAALDQARATYISILVLVSLLQQSKDSSVTKALVDGLLSYTESHTHTGASSSVGVWSDVPSAIAGLSQIADLSSSSSDRHRAHTTLLSFILQSIATHLPTPAQITPRHPIPIRAFSALNISSSQHQPDHPPDGWATLVSYMRRIFAALDPANAESFSSVIRVLCSHYLMDHNTLFRFFSDVYMDARASERQQLRALDLTRSLLLSGSRPSSVPLGVLQSLVASLLVPLGSSSHVRASALACMQMLLEVLNKVAATKQKAKDPSGFFERSVFGPVDVSLLTRLVRGLLNEKEELLAEAAYLRQVCSHVIGEGDAKAEEWLVRCGLSYDLDEQRLMVMHALKGVVSASKLTLTSPLLHTLLQQYAAGDALPPATMAVFDILLSQFTSQSAPHINSDTKLFKLYLEALSTSTSSRASSSVSPSSIIPAVTVLSGLTPVFFAGLTAEKQSAVLQRLAQLLGDPDSAVRFAAREAFSNVATNATILGHFLSSLSTATKSIDSRDWTTLNVVLELVQADIIETLDKSYILITPIFHLLKEMIDPDAIVPDDDESEDETPSSTMDTDATGPTEETAEEYAKQLCLGCLTGITDGVANNKTVPRKPLKALYSIDTIVSIFRTTSSSQTHNQCLLLLASLSRVFPDLVMTAIIPVFSSLSKSRRLGRDDQYSFHVLQKAIGDIVPPLVDTGSYENVLALIRIFVGALKHIPVPRRLPLFSALATTLSYKHLHTVLMSLMVKFVADDMIGRAMTPASNTSEEDEATHRVMFMREKERQKEKNRIHVDRSESLGFLGHTLCSHFSPAEITAALVHIARFAAELSLPDVGSVQGEDTIGFYFDSSLWSPRFVRLLRKTLLNFLARQISSKEFLGKLLNKEDAQNEAGVQHNYLLMFENLLEAVRALNDQLERLKRSKGQADSTHTSIITKNAQSGKYEARKGDWTPPSKGQSGRRRERHLDLAITLSYTVMDRINEHLTTSGFLQTVRRLLTHSDAYIRRRALQILNDRIEEEARVRGRGRRKGKGIPDEEVVMYIALGHNLATMIQGNETSLPLKEKTKKKGKRSTQDDTPEAQEEAARRADDVDVNQQTALLSLEILARNFASSHPASFSEHIPALMHAMSSPSVQVVASSLISLATFCAELGPHVLPYLPSFFPRLLDILNDVFISNQSATSDARSLLQVSSLSSLEVIVSHVAGFLHPYLVRILGIVTHPTIIASSNTQVTSHAHTLLTLITRKVEVRLLLEPIFASFDEVTSDLSMEDGRHKSMTALIDMVGVMCKNMSPKEMPSHYKAIFKFFLKAFEICSVESVMTSGLGVDTSTINAFMVLVFGISEPSFKPMFLKIFDWALGQQRGERLVGEQSRATVELSSTSTLYRTAFFFQLVESLAGQLKSIFVSYFGYILDDCIVYLHELAQQPPPLPVSANKKRKTPETSETYLHSSAGRGRRLLLQHILGALEKCFRFDADGFIDNAKFDRLLGPLVAQLDNPMMLASAKDVQPPSKTKSKSKARGEVSTYRSFITEYVVPCLTQLAVDVHTPTLWKPLNYQIMLKARSSNSHVRVSAVLAVQGLHERLGDELIELTDETLPFISELMEDGNAEARVERTVRIERSMWCRASPSTLLMFTHPLYGSLSTTKLC